MSAFIVDPKTVNRVVSWIESYCIGNSFQGDVLRRELAEVIGFTPCGYGDTFFYALAHAMMALNVNAVKQRYPDCTDDNLPGPVGFDLSVYRYTFEFCESKFQVLKSLQCWLYQCMEGDIPETSRLYKVMREFESQLALMIVSESKEYNVARWG